MRDILSMPFFDGFELIEHALDEETEEKLYLRWAIAYQHVMGFEEFKNQIGTNGKQVKDNRTVEAILETVRGIIG